jgi:hypothetical protein
MNNINWYDLVMNALPDFGGGGEVREPYCLLFGGVGGEGFKYKAHTYFLTVGLQP